MTGYSGIQRHGSLFIFGYVENIKLQYISAVVLNRRSLLTNFAVVVRKLVELGNTRFYYNRSDVFIKMPSVDVNCQQCGKGFSVDTEYFEMFGRDPYCQDCLIHTKCKSCGRPLRLEPSKYHQLGGDPVICQQCAQAEKQASSNDEVSSNGGWLQGTFWGGLTIGEKIVFPLLILVLVGILGALAMAEMGGQDADAGIIPAGLLVLIYWTYRRGNKNK